MTQPYDGDHRVSRKSTWSRSKIVITVTGVLLVLIIIIVISLWAGGVIFQNNNETSREITTKSPEHSCQCPELQIPDPAPCKTIKDYPEHSIERTILSVPDIQFSSVSNVALEDSELERQRSVLLQLEKESRDQNSSPRSTDTTSQLPLILPRAPGLEKFIQHILYINLEADTHKRESVEKEIARMNLPPEVGRDRLSAVKRSNGPLGLFLSHIACLSKALTLKQNVLIMEDDFVFDRTPVKLLEALQLAEEVTEGRWDVISFGQHVSDWQILGQRQGVKLCRLFRNTSTAGYLVHRLYVPRLTAFLIQRLRRILQKEKFLYTYCLKNIQTEVQTSDTWLGFHLPIGHQGDHRWSYHDNLEYEVNAAGAATKIVLRSPFRQRKVAVCMTVTSKEELQLAQRLQKDCFLKFLKLHHLEFFLWVPETKISNTDLEVKTESTTTTTLEGAPLHIHTFLTSTVPEKYKLYHFHHVVQAENHLTQFDFIYSIDVHYRIYQHPLESDLLTEDHLVAVEHMQSLMTKSHSNASSRTTLHHLGTPETNPVSRAFIGPGESMTHYFTSAFHGGDRQKYLTLCRSIRDMVNTDQAAGIEARCLEESYLNRYFLTHPPDRVLQHGYIFSERCLDSTCSEPVCIALREGQQTPVMGSSTR